jgi:hypothetical protein
MNHEKQIDIVESEWSCEDGFFWQLRQGKFTSADFERAMERLSSISITEEEPLPRRLVSLLWYIPLFMQWQVDRIQENGGDVTAYKMAITAMTNEVERLLGVP